MEPRPIIELHRVSKRYPNGTTALSDISLVIEQGEFCFLSGPSGAGKTTFIRLLMCMEPASDGQMLVRGRNLRMLQNRAIPFLRRNIGVVFQDFRLLKHRTVFDNVAIALEVLGLPRKEVVGRVNQILDQVGLADFERAYPPMLSGGEQQRVAIARALVNEPAIVLADEPTGNLDPVLSLEILNLIHGTHSRGTTVVVATHDAGLVDRYPGRVLSLNKGLLVDDTASRGASSARPRRDGLPGPTLAVRELAELEPEDSAHSGPAQGGEP